MDGYSSGRGEVKGIVMVNADRGSDKICDYFAGKSYVEYACETSGTFDLAIMVCGRDMREFDSHIEKIRKYKGVQGTTTFIVMREAKRKSS